MCDVLRNLHFSPLSILYLVRFKRPPRRLCHVSAGCDFNLISATHPSPPRLSFPGQASDASAPQLAFILFISPSSVPLLPPFFFYSRSSSSSISSILISAAPGYLHPLWLLHDGPSNFCQCGSTVSSVFCKNPPQHAWNLTRISCYFFSPHPSCTLQPSPWKMPSTHGKLDAATLMLL